MAVPAAPIWIGGGGLNCKVLDLGKLMVMESSEITKCQAKKVDEEACDCVLLVYSPTCMKPQKARVNAAQ